MKIKDKFITQKGMSGLRHAEAVVNSQMKRTGKKTAVVFTKCHCSAYDCVGWPVAIYKE